MTCNNNILTFPTFYMPISTTIVSDEIKIKVKTSEYIYIKFY